MVYLVGIVAFALMTLSDTVSRFPNHPGPIYLNENSDSQSALWADIYAICYPTTNIYFFNVFGIKLFKIDEEQHEVECETCELLNLATDLFFWSARTIYKRTCTTTSCGACPSCAACSTGNGCLNAPNSYTLVVICYTTTYDNNDSGVAELDIIIQEESPELIISLPNSVNADNSMSEGTVLATASKSSGGPIVQYTKPTAVDNTYSIGTANMFELNTANGQVYVATNPAVEYDMTYSIRVCIYTRRQESCKTMTINFDGCFQTPNCDSQTDTTSFSDQFPVGGIFFTMTYDPPSDHFAAISSTWQNLNFEIVSSTLNEASLDLYTGELSSTGNITVWPDYPYSTHTIVVRVSNPGHSCHYTATCTMTMQIAFTNWPIRIESLPASRNHHEDKDARTLVHSIITYDYNNPDHDNVTCVVVTNEEPTLLQLTHNGNFSYNSWFIYKKKCQDIGCGYIGANFLCDEKIACLNYDLDNEYTMTVKCSDAYGSDDTETFTLRVTENKPPVFTNTPTTITINTDNIAHLDNIFSIYYTDAESETLDYNYTISPTTPSLFAFDERGNYNNNPANVTATIFQWDLVNTTFSINFCGRERRNIVCSSFTIDIREYCGPTPVCTDASTTVTDQEAVAGYELFQITVTGNGYTQLTYVIISEYPELFSVDQFTGSVTIVSELKVSNAPNPRTYSLVANVYDTAACAVAACALSVEVTFTNQDISITNMGSVTLNIHEDTTESVIIVTIATSDANENDGVSCEVDEAASTPSNNNIFFAVETDTNSNVFQLISKEGPGFDYDVADTYKVVVVCEDNYGSSDTATATVSILENQVPTMDNLNAGVIINVDPMTVKSGATIFTLQTSDGENDPLVYSCNVTDSFVPLQCLSDGVVSLKRDVRIPDEEGEMYIITLCIEETVHSHVVCENLNVHISSSKTNPQLNNLPAKVSFAESTAVGTTLFTATVDDPDALDVYMFSMTVYPKSTFPTFSLDANAGVLTLQEPLDYETLNHYDILFSVRDVYLPGLEDKYLTITVTDVNEAPVLTLFQTVYEAIEESTGFSVASLNYSCTDVDDGQIMTVSISSGTYVGYFNLDPVSGIITYAQTWDFESGSALPQTTSLEIACADGNGLSDTGNIVINIALVNEFSPVLSTISEDITIYSNQTLIDPLFIVTAKDNDFGDDGEFVYSIIGEGMGSKYFTISNTGELFISNYIDWKYNFTFEFTVQVSDGESDPKMAYVDVKVTYLTSFKIPIPTKESAKCILCTKIGVTVVTILCVEGFLIFVSIIHVCVRMHAFKICRLNPKPRLNIKQDLKKDIDDRIGKTKDPYRPGSEMMEHALPEVRPPSPFNYNPPPKVTIEPPPAAEYIQPNSAIQLPNTPSPKIQGDSKEVSERLNKNDRYQQKTRPSIYQNKVYIPKSAMNDSLKTTEATNIYEYTKYDMLLPPEFRSERQIRVSPMFSRPDKSTLYSDNSKYLPDIGEPATAMDF